MTTHVPPLNRRVLTVFLLVSLPILVLGVALVLAIGQTRLNDSHGRQLVNVAQQTAASVDVYTYRRILDISLLARVPELRRDAAAASARGGDVEAARTIDRAWQETGRPPAPVAAIAGTPTSRFLADIVAHDQIYRQMVLTDRFGRVIAASELTGDYFVGDQDWWKAATEDGRTGRASVTDVRWDARARTYGIVIAVPVPEPDGPALAGVLEVVTDSREMLAAVGAVQPGLSGEATLLRDNGSVVFSRRTSDQAARFFAAEAVTQRLENIRRSGPEGGAYFRASRDGTPQLVGVAPSQLGRSFQNLSWLVAVTQSEDELLSPVRSLGWYLLVVVGLTVLSVLALALWFSMRLAEPQVDIDMHLVEHPALSHVGDLSAPGGVK